MRHDIAYRDAKNKDDIKSADIKMLNELNSLTNLDLSEKIGKTIAYNAIKLKQIF